MKILLETQSSHLIEFDTIDEDTVTAVVSTCVEGDPDVLNGTISGLSIDDVTITDPSGKDVTAERMQLLNVWITDQIIEQYYSDRR